jgi:hypothetical protein
LYVPVMFETQVARSDSPRGARIKQRRAWRGRRLAVLAGAASLAIVVLTSCSGQTNGSSSSGEGAVGANRPGNSHNSYGPGHAASPYQTVGAVGSQPGKLILKPSAGSTSVSPTWYTTDACPAGYQASAQLDAAMYGSTTDFQWISGTYSPGNSPIPPGQHLQFNSSVAEIQQVTKTPDGQTDMWVLRCAALESGLGNRQFVQYVLVHISPNGKTYTTSS